MRKIFTVIIHQKEYDVYDLEREHAGLNDVPKTWWLYYAERLPANLLPPPDSTSFLPFDSSIQRHVWEIKFMQKNSSKEKWGEMDFRNGTWVEMWCNKKLIYAFGTTGGQSGLSFAMAKVQFLQVALGEHPYNFFEPHENDGRKIYWHGLPATIKVKSDTWEIAIHPDYTCGLSKDKWWTELKRRESKINSVQEVSEWDEMEREEFEASYSSDSINWGDAYSDQHINWFRK